MKSTNVKTKDKKFSSGNALGVEYPGRDKTAVAAWYDSTGYELVYLDPYSGEVLKHKNMNDDFFVSFLMDIITCGCRKIKGNQLLLLLHSFFDYDDQRSHFMVAKKQGARKQRFRIKWSAKWRRKNYDLHNVLGFYMTWVAIFLAITGLVFGFQWFARSVYWISSGGETMVDHAHPVSDTTGTAAYSNMADHLWNEHRAGLKENESIAVYFASLLTDPIEVIINHKPGTYYTSDYYHHDQYSGKELTAPGSYAGKFAEASVADKIVRMNYDMHVGAILGLPAKLLSFFASLIAASLPITGFLIWRGRNKKRIGSRQVVKKVDELEQVN